MGPGADGLVVVDPSPLVAQVVAERDRGTPVPAIAAAFHVGLGNAVADVAADLASAAGVGVVALSGGVFQNARLTEIVERRLTGDGTRSPRPLEGAAQRRRGQRRAGGRRRPPRALTN